MDDLVTWLRSQLDVDENGGKPDQHTAVCGYTEIEFGSEECTCGIPVRALRRIRAMRNVIELCVTETDQTGGKPLAVRILRLAASEYDDCPGYREEWKP